MDVVLNSDYVNIVVSPLLDDCKQLLSCFQQVQIRHCYRQANCCADVMARMGSDQPVDYIVFRSPHEGVLEAFEVNCNGLFFDRRCTEFVASFQFNELSFSPKKKNKNGDTNLQHNYTQMFKREKGQLS